MSSNPPSTPSSPPSPPPLDTRLDSATLSLRQQFIVVRRKRIKPWFAWLAIGFFIGLASSILAIADQGVRIATTSATPSIQETKTAIITLAEHIKKADEARIQIQEGKLTPNTQLHFYIGATFGGDETRAATRLRRMCNRAEPLLPGLTRSSSCAIADHLEPLVTERDALVRGLTQGPGSVTRFLDQELIIEMSNLAKHASRNQEAQAALQELLNPIATQNIPPILQRNNMAPNVDALRAFNPTQPPTPAIPTQDRTKGFDALTFASILQEAKRQASPSDKPRYQHVVHHLLRSDLVTALSSFRHIQEDQARTPAESTRSYAHLSATRRAIAPHSASNHEQAIIDAMLFAAERMLDRLPQGPQVRNRANAAARNLVSQSVQRLVDLNVDRTKAQIAIKRLRALQEAGVLEGAHAELLTRREGETKVASLKMADLETEPVVPPPLPEFMLRDGQSAVSREFSSIAGAMLTIGRSVSSSENMLVQVATIFELAAQQKHLDEEFGTAVRLYAQAIDTIVSLPYFRGTAALEQMRDFSVFTVVNFLVASDPITVHVTPSELDYITLVRDIVFKVRDDPFRFGDGEINLDYYFDAPATFQEVMTILQEERADIRRPPGLFSIGEDDKFLYIETNSYDFIPFLYNLPNNKLFTLLELPSSIPASSFSGITNLAQVMGNGSLGAALQTAVNARSALDDRLVAQLSADRVSFDNVIRTLNQQRTADALFAAQLGVRSLAAVGNPTGLGNINFGGQNFRFATGDILSVSALPPLGSIQTTFMFTGNTFGPDIINDIGFGKMTVELQVPG